MKDQKILRKGGAKRNGKGKLGFPPSRCPWPSDDALMIMYHDKEWGKPVRDDKKLFEAILLDTFQAGLSWRTILHKRENFRKAFSNFDYKKVAQYGKRDIARLMNDVGIIRNKLKVTGSVVNAQRFIEVQKEFGSFAKYIWQFTGGKTIKNKNQKLSHMRATSKESDAMSKDLKKRGFKFVGSTICYAFMQGVGMVNDHLVSCFRYKEV
ncbi:MAG: DNA-3-methyladenine glycosylase I [Candidatus Yanofskybacteria bacterium]|nr:DNA-3-methyladenine glycosylase I [Candidatus Yanofskybacteria bacterium]